MSVPLDHPVYWTIGIPCSRWQYLTCPAWTVTGGCWPISGQRQRQRNSSSQSELEVKIYFSYSFCAGWWSWTGCDWAPWRQRGQSWLMLEELTLILSSWGLARVRVGSRRRLSRWLEQGLCQVLFYIWQVCDHCEEEFCQGACLLFDYDLHPVSHNFGGSCDPIEYGWM